MINKLLTKISGRLPYRQIKGPDGEPYLERYFLAQFPKWRWLGKWAGGTIYLHRFIGSDPDRGLHDHPWEVAYSFILSGWYVEERWQNKWLGDKKLAMKSGGALTRITGDDQHRVVMEDGAVTWSLFWHSKRIKGWGFFNYRDLHPGQSGEIISEPFDAQPDQGRMEKWWLTAGRRGAK